jgi:hypothetical protein
MAGGSSGRPRRTVHLKVLGKCMDMSCQLVSRAGIGLRLADRFGEDLVGGFDPAERSCTGVPLPGAASGRIPTRMSGPVKGRRARCLSLPHPQPATGALASTGNPAATVPTMDGSTIIRTSSLGRSGAPDTADAHDGFIVSAIGAGHPEARSRRQQSYKGLTYRFARRSLISKRCPSGSRKKARTSHGYSTGGARNWAPRLVRTS